MLRISGQGRCRMAIHSFAGTFPFSTHRAQTSRAYASPSRIGSLSIFAAMRRAIVRLRRSMPAWVFTTSNSTDEYALRYAGLTDTVEDCVQDDGEGGRGKTGDGYGKRKT